MQKMTLICQIKRHSTQSQAKTKERKTQLTTLVILMHIFHYNRTNKLHNHFRKQNERNLETNINKIIKIGPTSCALWPECRAVRADRLGYVQTGNCRVGQLLHMRAVI